MQDGAPAHRALVTRDFLINTFGADRIIGKHFDLPWDPQIPVDYFLWGYLRDRFFANEYSMIDRI